MELIRQVGVVGQIRDRDSISYCHPHLLVTTVVSAVSSNYSVERVRRVMMYEVKEGSGVRMRQVMILGTDLEGVGNWDVHDLRLYGFDTMEKLSKVRLSLDGNAVVMVNHKTVAKDTVVPGSRGYIDMVVWSRFDFDKEECQVIEADLKMAEEVLKKAGKEKEDRVAKREGETANNANGGKPFDDLVNSGDRVKGHLLNWHHSYGFLKLDGRDDAPNVFLHISDVRKPRPFLRPGLQVEFSIVVDVNRNQTKAVEAVAYK